MYQIYKSGKEWRWRYVAKNGENVASGEGYKRKRDCKKAVNLLKKSESAPVVELK